MPIPNLHKWLLRLFAVFWVAIVAIDYLAHSPYYLDALAVFPYWEVLLFALAGAGILAWTHRIGPGWESFQGIRGINLYAWMLVLQVFIFWRYGSLHSIESITSGDGLIGFLILALSGHLVLFGSVLLAAVYGGYLLRLAGMPLGGPVNTLVAIGLGFGLMALLLFLLAAAGLYSAVPVALLLLVAAVPGWRNIIALVQTWVWKKPKAFKARIWWVVPAAVLWVYMAVNLTCLLAPTPLGFDTINFYLNIPKLVAEGHGLVAGGQPYYWSLVMGIGFTLFGSTAMSLSLAGLPGILSSIMVYRITRRFTAADGALLAAALWYTFPVVGWQSSVEAKVDLALTMTLLAAVLLYLEQYWPQQKQEPEPKTKLLFGLTQEYAAWLLLGILFGIGAGIKFTALFTIMALPVAEAGRRWGFRGFWSGAMLAMAAIFALGLYKFAPIGLRMGGSLGLAGAFIASAVVPWFIGHRPEFRPGPYFKPVALAMVACFVLFLPWLGKNYLETKSFSLKTLITGKPLYPELPPLEKSTPGISRSLLLHWEQVRLLASNSAGAYPGNPLLAQNGVRPPPDADLRGMGRLDAGLYEEVARFMGYGPPFERYFALPYNVSLRKNVDNYAVDSGFWLMAFVPLLLLAWRSKRWYWNAAKMLALLLIYAGWFRLGGSLEAPPGAIEGSYRLLASLLLPLGQWADGIASIGWLNRNVVVFFLMGFTILPLWRGMVPVLRDVGMLWKVFASILAVHGLLWWLMGSGIPWYGIVAMALVAVWVVAMLRNKEMIPDKGIRAGAVVVIFGWLLVATVLRVSASDPQSGVFDGPYQRAFVPYLTGSKPAHVLEQEIIAFGPTVREINARPDGLVLRFGTYINYYLERNHERVVLDNQLNNFRNMYNFADGDPDGLFALMRELNIRFIIMSLHVGDDTGEDMLGRKAEQLMAFIRYHFTKSPPAIRMVHTDQDPERQFPGSYAAFELLYD